jgi:hypothetical protein
MVLIHALRIKSPAHARDVEKDLNTAKLTTKTVLSPSYQAPFNAMMHAAHSTGDVAMKFHE